MFVYGMITGAFIVWGYGKWKEIDREKGEGK
jgi:hypothetical protein